MTLLLQASSQRWGFPSVIPALMLFHLTFVSVPPLPFLKCLLLEGNMGFLGVSVLSVALVVHSPWEEKLKITPIPLKTNYVVFCPAFKSFAIFLYNQTRDFWDVFFMNTSSIPHTGLLHFSGVYDAFNWSPLWIQQAEASSFIFWYLIFHILTFLKWVE